MHDKNVIIHLNMGLLKRYFLITQSYDLLMENSGNNPSLSIKKSEELTIHINSFYINLRGGLDNSAFALNHYFKLNMYQNIIDLFGKDFKKTIINHINSYKDIIDDYNDWHTDLKQFRDTAAHRLPLYIPRSIITSDAQERDFNELESQRQAFIKHEQYTESLACSENSNSY